MKAPCGKVCPDRTAECKLTCERWAEFEAWKFEEEKRKKKIYEEAADYFAHVSEQVRKNQNKSVKH